MGVPSERIASFRIYDGKTRSDYLYSAGFRVDILAILLGGSGVSNTFLISKEILSHRFC